MKKLLLLLFVAITGLFMTASATRALINLDDESVRIAIKYGLDNKYSTTKTLLGPNWKEGPDGIILTIYSPFIQLATKSKSQNVPGSTDEDIILVKKRLGRQLNQITTRQEVRFIVQLVGDEPGFCKDYSARVEQYLEPDENKEEAEETDEAKKEGKGFWIFKKRAKKAKKLTPNKEVKQNQAEMDSYHPLHPYSCVNSYNFNFDRINDFDKFYFILIGPKEEEIKFLVDKNVIF
jgi:hypothetical protein